MVGNHPVVDVVGADQQRAGHLFLRSIGYCHDCGEGHIGIVALACDTCSVPNGFTPRAFDEPVMYQQVKHAAMNRIPPVKAV